MTSKKKLALIVAGPLAIALVFGVGIYTSGSVAMGAAAEGARLERMMASPQWSDGMFVNTRPAKETPWMATLQRYVGGGSDYRRPTSAIDVQARSRSDYASPPASGLRVTWLGHSTLLVEIGGKRVLIDPLFRPSLPVGGKSRRSIDGYWRPRRPH